MNKESSGCKNKSVYTRANGSPIDGDMNSLTVGREGNVLLQDLHQVEKLAHFDRERIPERVVHANGAGAFGMFRCYQSMKKYTCADFLSAPGKETPVAVRFSTVIGSKGSADTARDPRGFATKFYTQQGNYDLVGNNIPVFFIRDAIKFPDVIHSLKPDPVTNLTDPNRFWDFIALTPEATHMIIWLFSDFGTIASYRKMNGAGVNTYEWVNGQGTRHFVKLHWISQQGEETLTRQEATRLAGENPKVATKDLYAAIAHGNYPKYELKVQMMNPSDASKLEFDPLDDTKVWDETKYPLIPLGMMTLNRNPDNFFAQVEQLAFCPANVVPGIQLSADKMVQGRGFSYHDTQRYRLGVNFQQLPVNRPLAPVANHQQDGAATIEYSKSPINYSPNLLNNNMPEVDFPCSDNKGEACGKIVRSPIAEQDDFYQAGEKFRSFTREQQDHLIDNLAYDLSQVRREISNIIFRYLTLADPRLGKSVEAKTAEYRKF